MIDYFKNLIDNSKELQRIIEIEQEMSNTKSSKTRQRKCNSGLHEYMNNRCIHCNKILSEHNKVL